MNGRLKNRDDAREKLTARVGATALSWSLSMNGPREAAAKRCFRRAMAALGAYDATHKGGRGRKEKEG